MSQIYEALRRASERGEAEHVLPPEPDERSGEAAGTSLLDIYPKESPADVTPFPKAVGPEPARREAPARTTPRAPIAAPRKSVNPALAGRLVVSPEALPEAVDRFKEIAEALLNIQERSVWGGETGADRGLRTVMVTSALPGEGKSLTVVNLAFMLAETYKRHVLVIDANLHHPSIHEILALPNATGLNEALAAGPHHLQFQEVSKRLSVLPAGRCDASASSNLTCERMQAVIEACARRFDWVLVDGPAVTMLPDSRLGRCIRSVLFVVDGAATPFRAFEHAIAEVGRGCVIGVILNRATT